MNEIQVGSLKSLSDTEVVKLTALSLVSRILNTSQQLDEGLDAILEAVITALGAHRGFIQLFAPAMMITQDHSDGMQRVAFEHSRTLLETSLAERQGLVVLDATQEGLQSAIHTGLRSVMIQPILAGERLVGVFYLDSLIKVGAFGPNELKLLGVIADMVAGFLERTSNATALEQESLLLESALDELREANRRLRESAEETIYKLSRAADVRDDEGGEHVQRVSLYCEALALHLGSTPVEASRIRIAAQLHDVGKVGLPDSILLKTGRYTDHEREVMKQHTVIGARILSGSANPVIQLAEEMALRHHERWDGTGYPGGLSGEEIPYSGRLVAVADVFDALVTERRYKNAWTIERALQLIAENAGVHFDPDVSRAFLAIADQIVAIRDAHPTAPLAPVQAEVADSQSGPGGFPELERAVESLSRGEPFTQQLRARALAATRNLGHELLAKGRSIESARRLDGYWKREDLGQHHAPRLAELLAEIERSSADTGSSTTLLLVDPDPYQREALVIEASQRGCATLEAGDVAGARKAVEGRAPHAIVLEAALPGADAFLGWLALGYPDLPVLILTAHGGFERRFALAQHGTQILYLDKPVSAGAVLDQLELQMSSQLSDAPRILQVPLGGAVTPGLQELGLAMTVVADMAELCAPPGQRAPDLYLLEADVVNDDILELCRVLRSDPRLGPVPIILTVVEGDEKSSIAALQAGADEVLRKPLSADYLAARLHTMLKRQVLIRRSALRDPVTGLIELRAALRMIQQLLALAVRNAVPFTICTVKVERFAELQGVLGAEGAALVLCQLANILERGARTSDVLARYEESAFLLALYGSSAESVNRRGESINAALAELPGIAKGSARCSVQVATYPADGTRVLELLRKVGVGG